MVTGCRCVGTVLVSEASAGGSWRGFRFVTAAVGDAAGCGGQEKDGGEGLRRDWDMELDTWLGDWGVCETRTYGHEGLWLLAPARLYSTSVLAWVRFAAGPRAGLKGSDRW